MKMTVCLNMIVKNEAKVIQKCLESLKHIIDCWVIVDTGSNDGTQKIIEECLKDIPGQLYERPWVDFAFNRNEALDLAKNRGDYFLFIDADESFEWSECSAFPPLDKDYYMGIIHHGAFVFLRTILVNSRFDWKWVGIVHEFVTCAEGQRRGVLFDPIVRSTKDGNRSQDIRKKLRKDIELLEDALQMEPENTRHRFHLAQHYEGVQEYALALKNYEMLVSAGVSDLEVFYSLYRMALMQKELKMQSEIFINNYLKAFQMRPWRAEPLYFLASHFMDANCYLLGYLIMRYALSIELFNEYFLTAHEIYSYGLLYQYAECAFRIGKYQEAYEGLKRLLAVKELPLEIREAGEKNLSLLSDRFAFYS